MSHPFTAPGTPARRAFRSLVVPTVLVFGFGACASARGGVDVGPIVTDRPDFTESPQTVPAGMVQAEGGYTFARAGSVSSHSVGEGLARIATGARTELRVGVNSYGITSAPGARVTGIEDASIGGKVAISAGAERFAPLRPAVALIVATSLPTGGSAYGSSDYQPEAKLVVGYTLTERLAWTSNLNYAYASEGGRRFDQASVSTSFGFSVADRVGSYAEFFSFMPESRGGPAVNYVNGGVTYLFSSNFQLDGRIGRAVGSGASDAGYFAGVGISRRW